MTELETHHHLFIFVRICIRTSDRLTARIYSYLCGIEIFKLQKCKSGSQLLLAWNPQANSVLKHFHQVLGNCLRNFDIDEQDLDEDDPLEEFLTAIAYTIKTNVHILLWDPPGQLIFGRDMILPIKYWADWDVITQRRQCRFDQSNTCENSKRIDIECYWTN